MQGGRRYLGKQRPPQEKGGSRKGKKCLNRARCPRCKKRTGRGSSHSGRGLRGAASGKGVRGRKTSLLQRTDQVKGMGRSEGDEFRQRRGGPGRSTTPNALRFLVPVSGELRPKKGKLLAEEKGQQTKGMKEVSLLKRGEHPRKGKEENFLTPLDSNSFLRNAIYSN